MCVKPIILCEVIRPPGKRKTSTNGRWRCRRQTQVDRVILTVTFKITAVCNNLRLLIARLSLTVSVKPS